MTLLQRGFAMLNRAMEPAAAEQVRYMRGAVVVSDTMLATLSAQDVEQLTEGGGTAVIGRSFTWRLLRSSLYIDSLAILPQRNDIIEWNWQGRLYRFEVLPDQGSSELSAYDPRSDWVAATVKLVEQYEQT